jgi:hypothetical protein
MHTNKPLYMEIRTREEQSEFPICYDNQKRKLPPCSVNKFQLTRLLVSNKIWCVHKRIWYNQLLKQELNKAQLQTITLLELVPFFIIIERTVNLTLLNLNFEWTSSDMMATEKTPNIMAWIDSFPSISTFPSEVSKQIRIRTKF